MFEEIITSKELKFNDLEKKVYRFICFIGCLIIKLILESYDRNIMQSRDKEKYRHKGLRETSVNTIMGEIKYKRAMYEIHEEGINKRVYLLDEKLKAGLKEITALFEETDGLWINLQGKDRQKRIENNKQQAKIKNKEFNTKMKVKAELKLHVMYEGWKKDDIRHSLVNKQYIAGIMKPKEIAKLRDARVYSKYDESKIKLRVTNGDGAKWTKGTTCKGGIYQKDQFHIMQEITRDVPKEYRNIIIELINKKEFKQIQPAIDGLKYELNGEYQALKKLDKLKSYLSSYLKRYQDIVKVPQAPERIEYRNLGTQESQIFSKLKKRFCSGRKAFGLHGANALSKVCVLSEKITIDDIESPIPIDTSAEEWIKEIEENVRKNRLLKNSFLATESKTDSIGVHIIQTKNKLIKEILKYQGISELKSII